VRAVPLVAFLLLSATTAFAQDVVRLRSGKFLSGTVALVSKDADGFLIELWDTRAVLYVKWDQVPGSEKDRLLNVPPPPVEVLLEGAIVSTPYRLLRGLVVKEDASVVHVKSSERRESVPVPKSAILRRDPVSLREADVYTPEELLELRVKKAEATDARGMLDLGRFAAKQKLYERAREYCLEAVAADPSRKAEIDVLLAEIEACIREARAKELLAGIKQLVAEVQYAKAVEGAKALLKEFPDTQAAKSNPDLVAEIDAEAKEFQIHREEVLARKVPDLWRARRSTFLSRCAALPMADSRMRLARLDDEVMEELARRMKATPLEVRLAWEKRPEKNRVASYGSGTWIVRGGQDGGLDFQDPQAPPQNQPPEPTVYIPIKDAEGRTILMVPATDSPRPPRQLGLRMQTRDEWWVYSGFEHRKDWLEAEYVSQSPFVKKIEEKPVRCPACLGAGLLRAYRSGKGLDVTCFRCHGVRQDVTFLYW